jgi:hypothetical protein
VTCRRFLGIRAWQQRRATRTSIPNGFAHWWETSACTRSFFFPMSQVRQKAERVGEIAAKVLDRQEFHGGTGGVVAMMSPRYECQRYRPVTPRQVSFGQSAPTALVATVPNLASDTQTRPTAEAGHRPSTRASVRRRCACARQSGRATVVHSRLRILGHSP